MRNYNKGLTKAKSIFIFESLLPFSKEQIKDSIKVCLLVHKDEENLKYQCNLAAYYVSLSSFIPDREVNIANKVFNNIENHKPNDEETLNVYFEVQKAVNREWKTLYFEILEFLPGKNKNKILNLINRK